jgi:hypothetical protein
MADVLRKPSGRSGESGLLRQVLDWLTLQKLFHWRANSGGGVRPDGRGGWRPIKGNAEGTPDVLILLPARVHIYPEFSHAEPAGRLCGCELKGPKGRLRAAQKAWMEKAEKAGALCLVIDSLDGLIDALRREGYIP